MSDFQEEMLSQMVSLGIPQLKAYLKQKSVLENVVKNVWQLSGPVCNLLKENEQPSNKLCDACSAVLDCIAENAVAKEFLISLLEQIDKNISTVALRIILPALSKCLQRINFSSRHHSLGISLEAIYSCVEGLKLPELDDLNEKELTLMECDNDLQEINDRLECIFTFLQPFVDSNAYDNAAHSDKQTSDMMLFFLSCLNFPFLHMNFAIHSNGFEPTGRIVVEKCLKLLTRLIPDYMKVLDLIQDHNRVKLENNDGDKQLQLAVPSLAIANMMHLVLGEDLTIECFASVHTGYFLLQKTHSFAEILLADKSSVVAVKGVVLIAGILRRVGTADIADIPSANGPIGLLALALSNTAIYQKSRLVRIQALDVLKKLITRFCFKGRILLAETLLRKSTHSGVHGFAIGVIKDELVTALKAEQKVQVQKVFSLIFALPEGEKSDLLENSEHIMAALNLLRYLILKDKNNYTGIHDLIPTIKTKYLKALNSGIKLSRAHYYLDKEKLDRGEVMELPNEVDISVHYEKTLPEMNIDQRKHVIDMSLLTFDVILSILVRVEEIISQNDDAFALQNTEKIVV